MEGVVTIDSNGIILGANPAAAEMFGYAPGELPGCNVKILMPEPHREKHDSDIAHHLRTANKSVVGIRAAFRGSARTGKYSPRN